MKRIIITESQLKHILGEDFSSYLPNIGSKEMNSGINGMTKINSKDADENGNFYNSPTLDKTAKEKSRYSCYGTRSTTSMVRENKKMVSEENSQLQNSFTVSGVSKSPGAIAYMKHKRDVDGQELTDTEEMLVKKADNSRNQIKSHKTMMKNIGMENQFQKAGGQKETGNGMAHTNKKNNGISITYEN